MRSFWSKAARSAAWLACLGAVVAALLMPSSTALAQQYPARAVRLIVGFPAGTAPDVVARVVAQKLQEAWGVGVTVDNKPGAAGVIAAGEAARAAPDGYTLYLATTSELAITPYTHARPPYNPEKDFAPVSAVASTDFALVINPEKTPFAAFHDYANWARSAGSVFMGTFGPGSIGHFGAVAVSDLMRVKPDFVHYRSTGDAMTGIISGAVHGIVATPAVSGPHLESGKLRALATTGTTRSRTLPDVPTFKELGFDDFDIITWFGVFAPPRTPVAILDKLNADIVRAVQTPDSRARLEAAGFAATGTGREEFAAMIGRDGARWSRIVAATGFKAQD